MIGQLLNERYKIEKLLGKGRSHVYQGNDLKNGRKVAIKITSEEKNLLLEEKLLKEIKHSNLPEILDVFTDGIHQCIVMVKIPGKNLIETPQDCRQNIFGWVFQICDALKYLHNKSNPITHRDIKPENIIIRDLDNSAILVDFGISKIRTTTPEAKMTSNGYSPPEQNQKTDNRSDIYSLGATLYYCLTGVVPAESKSRHPEDTLDKPRKLFPDISAELEDAILKAMSYFPEDRFQSIEEFEMHLDSCRPTPKPTFSYTPTETAPESDNKHNYQNTTTWRTAFDIDTPDHERLRVAYSKFHRRVSLIASEIYRDLPTFIVPDISHLDALWEMADLLMHDSMNLNPCEVFVLGGAFLIHDLGLGLAAYPEGPKSIRQGVGWKDSLTAAFVNYVGRFPSLDELVAPSEEIVEVATMEILRERYAVHARKFVLCKYSADSEDFFLLDDDELRQTLGPTIGEIAHSRWWSVSQVQRKFASSPPLGSLAQFDPSWTVDRLKIACLFRACEAIQLDARLAPAFLHALRKPKGFAVSHWCFQQSICKPYVQRERVVFTSGHRFKLTEVDAWWTGVMFIRQADKELREIDAMLVDCNYKYRLAARAVVGASDVSQLVNWIPTEGWNPVDASVHVSDIASLAHKLGGEQLYGDDQTVPLRELIQNACDAVRARKILAHSYGDEYLSPRVTIIIGKDDNGPWLEVKDNGIGMSLSTLTKELLDFGQSYWGSQSMREEFPGLQSSGFRPTGKYGLGFFSVFMWGDKVRVTSRIYLEGSATKVLEFYLGTTGRPLVRSAMTNEKQLSGGTCVRVWASKIIPEGNSFDHDQIAKILPQICPMSDVDIYLADREKSLLIVGAEDWLSCSVDELINRTLPNGIGSDMDKKYIEQSMRILHNPNGQPVGRACILSRKPYSVGSGTAVITIGGLRSNTVQGIFGCIAGSSKVASRMKADPIIAPQVLAQWATEQGELIAKSDLDDACKAYCTALVIACGGIPDPQLPIAHGANGWLKISDNDAWSLLPDHIHVLPELIDGVMPKGVNTTRSPKFLTAVFGVDFWPIKETHFDSCTNNQITERRSVLDYIVEALSHAWGCSPNDIQKQTDNTKPRVQYDQFGNPHAILALPTTEFVKPGTGTID